MANYVTYTTTVKLNTKEAQNQLEDLKRKVEDLKQKMLRSPRERRSLAIQ